MPKVPEQYLSERRRQIAVAASRVFSRKGVQAATMAEVATEAGISPGLIYRYFSSKDELVSWCTSESAQEVEDQWRAMPQADLDPMQEFTQLSRQTFAVLEAPEERFHTVLALEHLLTAMRDENEDELRMTRDGWNEIIDRIELRLRAAQQRGQFVADVDAGALARVLFAMYWGTRLEKMVDAELDVKASLEAAMRLIQGGLGGARK